MAGDGRLVSALHRLPDPTGHTRTAGGAADEDRRRDWGVRADRLLEWIDRAEDHLDRGNLDEARECIGEAAAIHRLAARDGVEAVVPDRDDETPTVSVGPADGATGSRRNPSPAGGGRWDAGECGGAERRPTPATRRDSGGEPSTDRRTLPLSVTDRLRPRIVSAGERRWVVTAADGFRLGAPTDDAPADRELRLAGGGLKPDQLLVDRDRVRRPRRRSPSNGSGTSARNGCWATCSATGPATANWPVGVGSGRASSGCSAGSRTRTPRSGWVFRWMPNTRTLRRPAGRSVRCARRAT